MAVIDLVFRTVGERTSDISLEMAIRNINPDRLHIVEHATPFTRAVQQMLEINYVGDFVVFMDADCLILEDLGPFLQSNTLPFVDSYLLDKFRGMVHAGVHITRIDVVRAMQNIRVSQDDRKYVLKPESRTRALALWQLGEQETYQRFHIVHDFCQYYRDIFAKYALRELRSRKQFKREKLDLCRRSWPQDDLDYVVAAQAIDFARVSVGPDSSVEELSAFIDALPTVARRKVALMAIPEKASLTTHEVSALKASSEIQRGFARPARVFVIGLAGTGTASVATALDLLGYNVIQHLRNGQTGLGQMGDMIDLAVLEVFDGIADPSLAPFFAQLDRSFPDSKFILTTPKKEAWLRGIGCHEVRKANEEAVADNRPNSEVEQVSRAAASGGQRVSRDELSRSYDAHHSLVLGYFRERPNSLLTLNLSEGEGWDKLCPFLGQSIPEVPFPILDNE